MLSSITRYTSLITNFQAELTPMRNQLALREAELKIAHDKVEYINFKIKSVKIVSVRVV